MGGFGGGFGRGAPSIEEAKRHMQMMAGSSFGGSSFGGGFGGGGGGGYNQNDRQSKKLYVGNVNMYVSERDVVDLFNSTLAKIETASEAARAGNAVTNYKSFVEKSFAFVEFQTAQDATLGMGLDGFNLNGVTLKVRRPKDYVPPPGGDPHSRTRVHIPGVVSTVVEDTPHKIFIGGIPNHLNEDQIQELLKPFGELRAFNLVRDPQGQSRGYAFCEFVDPSATDMAIQGLDNLPIGDRTITVKRANNDGGGGGGFGGGGGGFGGGFGGSGGNDIPLGASSSMSMMMSGAMPEEDDSEPTRILWILNAFWIRDLQDDDNYRDIYDDMWAECEIFGKVLECKIPRPAKGRRPPFKPGQGFVFVKFENVEDAAKARTDLAGRKFHGHVVITSFYDEEAFDANEFEGVTKTTTTTSSEENSSNNSTNDTEGEAQQ
eukprot:TRINITY_DN10866_c0_g1_i1.p1 TRINITY_DN10866_c0_g1~~TRINITY_DN10866_c0_g1_i1.p1  ORF type:complete len:432 (-),score=165.17 TRINITY_DN10866_c0_g1_i1:136-1431(-)